MRGSVYFQTAELIKCIFQAGIKKEQRIDSKDDKYGFVSSYNTAKSYRNVWNNFFNYLLEHWKIENCEEITDEHVLAYLEYKIEYYPTQQYLQKISAAMGSLELALNVFSKKTYDEPKIYDFSIRKSFLQQARELDLIAKNYKNRAYTDPELIIKNLGNPYHQLAAQIQVESGARVEGVTLIKQEQLKGVNTDKLDEEKFIGSIETKEKGGKVGEVFVSYNTYQELEMFFIHFGLTRFKIDYQAYAKDIRETCIRLGIEPMGSHGFRWSFAKRRVREYQRYGYSYEQAIQAVSWEMKHYRASITEHYL